MELDLSKESLLQDQLKQLVREVVSEQLQSHLDKMKTLLPPVQEMYYSPAQVAEMLNYDRKSVYRWIEEGKIKPVLIGVKMRIPQSELNKFVSGNEFKQKHQRKLNRLYG